MKTLLLVLRAAAVVTVAGVFALLALWSGPDVEIALAPVLTEQSSGHVERLDDGRTACWTWYFGKVRPAEVTDANWTIRSPAGIFPFQRVRRVADSDEDGDRLARRRVKPGQWSRKCIDVPPELAGVPFRITGFAEYRTAWTGHFWSLRQPVAEVSVP